MSLTRPFDYCPTCGKRMAYFRSLDAWWCYCVGRFRSDGEIEALRPDPMPFRSLSIAAERVRRG